MSDYIWHIVEPSGEVRYVLVLAWHEGKATVVDTGQYGPLSGRCPYIVKTTDLVCGRHSDDTFGRA